MQIEINMKERKVTFEYNGEEYLIKEESLIIDDKNVKKIIVYKDNYIIKYFKCLNEDWILEFKDEECLEDKIEKFLKN